MNNKDDDLVTYIVTKEQAVWLEGTLRERALHYEPSKGLGEIAETTWRMVSTLYRYVRQQNEKQGVL